jgi:hypothetical protein
VKHPRSQWRVRAGFTPASLDHRPLELRILSLAGDERPEPAQAPSLPARLQRSEVAVEIAERVELFTQLGMSGDQASRVLKIL